jgi:hypothetical protein
MSPKPERETSAAELGSQQLDKARFAPANRRRLSPPALRTFLAIADLWGLTEEQRLLVLGYPSRSTYHNWCKQARARQHRARRRCSDAHFRGVRHPSGAWNSISDRTPWCGMAADPAQFNCLRRPTAARSRDERFSGRLAHRATFPGCCARGHLYATERDRSGIRALQRFRARLPVTFGGPCTASGLSSHSLTISTDRTVRYCCDRR